MVALRNIVRACFDGALNIRLAGFAGILAIALLTPLTISAAQAACSSNVPNTGDTVTCTGTDNAGVVNTAANGVTVTVQPSATIDITALGGGNSAIGLNNGNVIINSGTILLGDSDAGIFANNGNTVSNLGVISGGLGSYGISVNNGNSVFNGGTITMLDAGVGINVCCSNTSVVNTGKITVGVDGLGIAGSDGNTIINSGMIVVGASGGLGAAGIDVFDNNTVRNSGTIIVGDSAVGIGLGNNNLEVVNSGTIQVGQSGVGIGQTSFAVGGDGNVITNSGTITTDVSGIGISQVDGNQITNSGTLNIGAGGIGVEVGDLNTINNSGLIWAPAGYALYGGSDNIITNTGTMVGTIILSGFDNTLTNQGAIVSSDLSTTIGASNFIGGTLVNDPSGTIGIRVDPFNNDYYQADNITLNGGRLNVIVTPGIYEPTTIYSTGTTGASPLFVCGCGALSGAFATVTSTSPFFMAAATYDYGVGEVNITLTRLAFNAVPGMTDNQRAVGNALEPLYDPNTLTGNAATFFSNLLAATSLGALDALSGEGLTQAQSTAFQANQLFSSTLLSQINAWLAGNPAGGGALAYAQADAARVPAAFKALDREQRIDGWRVWMAGFFGQNWANGELPAGSANARARTGGGAFGVDRQIASDMLAGIAVGASDSTFNVPDRQTEGDILGGHIAAYGIKTWGAFYTSGSVGYARFDNTTKRTIAGIGTTEFATGQFASDLVGGRAELGYRTRAGQYNVTPFVAIEPSHQWQRGFTETSFDAAGAPGILGLNVAARSVSSLPLFVGAQVDTRVMLPNGTMLVPNMRASWVHEFMPDREINASFITLPDAAFTVQGARAARDSGKIGAGARWFFNSAAYAFANFDGEFSDRTAGYSASAGFKSNW